MQKWEYKVLDWVNEKQFNELGRQGWELVAIATISAPIGSSDEWQAVFKRPISN